MREKEPNSHASHGWEQFTDVIIRSFTTNPLLSLTLHSHINKHCEHVVFMLWGAYAQKKG